jgi:hypothetical protein
LRIRTRSQVLATDTDSFADRQPVGYRLRVRDPNGSSWAEQRAYHTECNGQISGMRVLCSGFRPYSGT